MLRRVLRVIGLLFWAGLSTVRADTRYFDDVPKTISQRHYGVRIAHVARRTPYRVGKDTPASRSQPRLRIGDVIVGLDGRRVRSLEEYTLVRFQNREQSTVPLTVLRKGLFNVIIDDPLPLREIGFTPAIPTTDDFLVKLREWNIPLRPTMSDTVDAHRVTYRQNQFYACFPPRARSLGLQFAASGQQAKEWFIALVSVYSHLRLNDLDAAEAAARHAALADRSGIKFLDQLLAFYRVNCMQSWSPNHNSPPWKGVTPEFFAMCYPFPIKPESAPEPFTANPEYARYYEEAIVGVKAHPADWAVSSDVQRHAYRLISSNRSQNVDGYLQELWAALIDPQRHGGWPYRSPMMHGARRREVLEALKQRWDDEPTERNMTAMALLVPTFVENDSEWLQRAYRHVEARSIDDIGIANGIVLGARLNFGEQPDMDAIVDERNRARLTSGFHQWLLRVSPEFRTRVTNGLPYRWGGRVVRADDWLCRNRHVVALAIRSPLVAPDSRTEVTHFAEARERLEREPSPTAVSQFVQAGRTEPVGQVMDALGDVLTAQYVLSGHGLNRVDLSLIVTELFHAADRKHFMPTVESLVKMTADSTAMLNAIDQLYRTNGTPALCMRIARHLDEIRYPKAAMRYRQRVQWFYERLYDTARAYQRKRDQYAAYALRDLALTHSRHGSRDGWNWQRPAQRLGSREVWLMTTAMQANRALGNRSYLYTAFAQAKNAHATGDPSSWIVGDRLYDTTDAFERAVDDFLRARNLFDEEKIAQYTTSDHDSLPSRTPLNESNQSTTTELATTRVLTVKDSYKTAIWFVTNDDVLGRENTWTGQISYFPHAEEQLGVSNLKPLAIVPGRNFVWVGSNRGLLKIDRDDWSWQQVPVNERTDITVTELRVDGQRLILTVDGDDNPTDVVCDDGELPAVTEQ